MSRISERLLAAQRIELNTKPLLAALRDLKRVLEHPKARLYADSLAARSTIAVGRLERGPKGMTITVKPARELAMFLQRVKRLPPAMQADK